jgi:hypothetical protein
MGAILETGAAVLAFGGAIIAAYGTYLLTKWYQPFRFWGLVGSLWDILCKLLTGRKQEAIKKIEEEADFAAFLNEENKATSLFGIYLVLISFGLQVIAAFLAMADTFIRR